MEVSLEQPGRCFLKCFAHGGSIAIGEACALDEEDVNGLFHRVNPALGAMGPTVAVSARAEYGSHVHGLYHHLETKAHAHALGKTSFEVAGGFWVMRFSVASER